MPLIGFSNLRLTVSLVVDTGTPFVKVIVTSVSESIVLVALETPLRIASAFQSLNCENPDPTSCKLKASVTVTDVS